MNNDQSNLIRHKLLSNCFVAALLLGLSAYALAVDTDGDGLADDDEINLYGTDPNLVDSDSDSLPDGFEISVGLDPLQADSSGGIFGDENGDGVSNDVDEIKLLQRGASLVGAASDDNFGNRVSLSEDGLTLAVGAAHAAQNGGSVSIYHWSSDAWSLRGTPIIETLPNSTSSFGHTVSLSANGEYVAVSDPIRGLVRVYVWNGTAWETIDSGNLTAHDIAPSDATTEFAKGELKLVGSNLTGDGQTLAIAIGDQGVSGGTGKVYVYEWQDTGNGCGTTGTGTLTWCPLAPASGTDASFVSTVVDEQYGASIDLVRTPLGLLVVAIGARQGNHNSCGQGCGFAENHEWAGTSWFPRGLRISGDQPVSSENSTGELAHVVSLSADGNRIALGSPRWYDSATGIEANVGRVRVYDWSGSLWGLGNTISHPETLFSLLTSPLTHLWFGSVVQLSADGNLLSVSVGENQAKGGAYLYTRSGLTAWTKIGNSLLTTDFSASEGGEGRFGFSSSLSADGSRLAVGSPSADSPSLTNNGRAQVFQVFAQNDAPTALPDFFTVDEDSALSAAVSSNDTQGVNGGGTWSTLAEPVNGTLNLFASGTFTYTPNTNFSGTDTFTYTLTDGDGDVATSTVTITVNPIDDPPVAESRTLTVLEDSPATNLGLIEPITPDPGETLTVTVIQVPGSGEGLIFSAGASLTVGDTLTPSELAALTFVPNSNYDGTVADFDYSLSDGTGSDDSQGSVSFTIVPQNDVPIAVKDIFAMNEGSTLTGNVAANDAEGDSPSNYSLAVNATHGVLELNNDGSFSYAPFSGFAGSDFFEYDLTDADNEGSSAFVDLTIVAATAVDTDGDGVADEVDAYPTIDLGALIDSDGDGAPDICDASCQSLGMNIDAFPNNATEWVDTDSDGVGNNTDFDDDGDGVSDFADDFPLDPSESSDTDGDGIGNNADLDDDNDGVGDSSDPFPQDTDDDGTDNPFDPDDDNDGVYDELDAYPLISVFGFLPDYDADGAPDTCDSLCLGTGMQADPDDDNDGVLDSSDDLPFNNMAALDSDGDGYADEYLPFIQSFFEQEGISTNDLPLDQTIFALDAFPFDAGEWRDIDGDGIGDNADSDDDNDGTNDSLDILPENPTWDSAVASTTSEGAQLIIRSMGALTHPDINFANPNNGSTIELGTSQTGQFRNEFGTTSFTWEIDAEGWLNLQGDLADLSHQQTFEMRVSALGDLITSGLMNTLALDPGYAANLFQIREMVADFRLIKVGDQSDWVEVYAVESVYGYYIVDAGLRAQVLAEMLIQQPERVDEDRELILGFQTLGATSFLRGDSAPSQQILSDGLPFGGTQAISILPGESSYSLGDPILTEFPIIPESLLELPFEDEATWNTQLALFASGGQGTFEGVLECAFTWTDNTDSLELTVTQVPSESTCTSAGAVHTIRSMPISGNNEQLLYIQSTSSGETAARLIVSVGDTFGATFDPANIGDLLLAEEVLVSGAQLSDPRSYLLDANGVAIFNLDGIDAALLKNDGTFSVDNIPLDGTAKYIDSITPGNAQVEDWQWIATNDGIGFIDPNGSGMTTIDAETGEATPIPDITWRVLDYDLEGRLWVIETELITESSLFFTESRLNFYTVLNQDQDGDLELDFDEFVANRDPFTFNDADGDGLSDADETINFGTDPNDSDSDDDGASDGLDIEPLSPELSGLDTNLDGIDDAWAATFYSGGLNPTDDLDEDGLTVLEEYVSGTSDLNFNQVQIISIPELRLRSNRVTRVPLSYSTSDGIENLPGLGLRIHFHSANLALFKFEAASAFLNGLIEINNVWAPDTFNLDANFFTDHYIEISWADQNNTWPGESLPINLGHLLIAPRPDNQSGAAVIGFSPSALAPDYGLSAHSLTLNYSAGRTFDIDEDGDVTALSDGLMMLRFLFGFTGDFESLIGENSPHIGNPAAINQRLNEHLSFMDIDDDDTTQALTDGLLLIRYLFGFRGDALVEGATSLEANRASASEIEIYLEQYIQ